MDRTIYIEIGNKQYPMRFSVGVSIEINKKFGSLKKMSEALSGRNEEQNEGVALETILWLLEAFIRQGCSYKNIFEADIPIPENAPVVDGKYVPLSREELQVGISMISLKDATMKIYEVMGIGNKQEISADLKDNKKNVETM